VIDAARMAAEHIAAHLNRGKSEGAE